MKVGLVLPLAEYPWKQPSYTEIRSLALQAEGAGFDSIWVFDHLLFREPGALTEGIWESWTVLSALAEATDRVEIGTFVLCTAFRNPAVLAKMAVTLDAVSDGRLILGLGCGWHKPEFDAFGIPFEQRVDRFEEALEIILPLLREGTRDFEGRHYRVRGGELKPRAGRVGGPPVLVGALRPRMMRLAARHADLWNACWFGDPTSLGEVPRRIDSACVEVGRDPGTLGRTLGVNVAVGPDADRLPPDRAVLSGSPETVARGLLEYCDLGIDHVICNLNPHDADAQRRLSGALHLYRAGLETRMETKANALGRG